MRPACDAVERPQLTGSELRGSARRRARFHIPAQIVTARQFALYCAGIALGCSRELLRLEAI